MTKTEMRETAKSIYDNIKTAKDLIFEVKAHGLSIKTEDICRAQDIFGNSTVGELEALATDTGRRDEDGTPNQFGSWTTGKDGTQRFFYQIIFEIWGWERATEYYNQHSNPLYIEGRKAVKERDALKEELICKENSIAKLNGDIAEYKGAIEQMRDEKVDYQKEIDEKDAEIVKLKARLYDLMAVSVK